MACGLFILLAALLVLVGGLGVLVWLAARRVARHLAGNPEAARLISEHLITPLLIGKQEPKPEPKKIKSTLV